MSWINNRGYISLKEYEDFDEQKSKKYEKHVIKLIEMLQSNFSEIERISKELRYYTLYVKWGSQGFQITPLLDEIGYYSYSMKENFDDKVNFIFNYLKDFKEYYFTKLKKAVIEKIERLEEFKVK